MVHAIFHFNFFEIHACITRCFSSFTFAHNVLGGCQKERQWQRESGEHSISCENYTFYYENCMWWWQCNGASNMRLKIATTFSASVVSAVILLHCEWIVMWNFKWFLHVALSFEVVSQTSSKSIRIKPIELITFYIFYLFQTNIFKFDSVSFWIMFVL